ncbi:hypothetical protein [Methylobacterium sp. ID0610]|uniref:hypothetical protein n=1 Tax=Methylobacterium carpenticola TaxID=3344827 RepID=UPI0036AB077F
MVRWSTLLAAALLLSGGHGADAQTRWTDPPTRTADPVGVEAPPRPAAEQRTGVAPKPARRQARRAPVRSRVAVSRPPRVARRPAATVRPARLERARLPPPPRPVLSAQRSGPVIRSRAVAPWAVRVGPWAGDIDCSSPYAPAVRRGLCPWAPDWLPEGEE